MCLIIVSIGQHPDFPLVVAANRDEFHQRPTAAMDWWPQPDLLAGRDLKSGGTWLAVDRSGNVAAVTNVREGTPETGRHSRGELPLQALTTATETLQGRLMDHQDDYSGFNLIRLSSEHQGSGWYYSNRDAHPGRHLHRGSYGLSNHLLQSPWPKLLRLRNAVAATLASHAAQPTTSLHRQLVGQLQDTTPAPDHVLPDTGVGLATERFLSAPFILGPHYGTRATTVVTVRRDGEVAVTEQSWSPTGDAVGTRQFCWQREPLI
ncbi:NRDE family protein [Marinobacter sp. SS21]|uniref:NRDE family protein n=1 Tax=Marinobacter sp. SS21 TaxID=2979460 RepID=UPI002330B9E8|nr:NRDE family protein [Marinobacter sp. SS21]MDC0664061.1 NRDE family protein [Marinobacter sp. SS21]